MALFNNNPAEKDAKRVLGDEHKLTNYNYRVRATLQKLVDEVKQLNNDLRKAHDALKNVVEHERIDLTVGRNNIVSRLSALKGAYAKMVDMGREGALRPLAESAKDIPPRLDGIIANMRNGNIATRQQLAEQLEFVFSHAAEVDTKLTYEERRLQETLAFETQQLRRVS